MVNTQMTNFPRTFTARINCDTWTQPSILHTRIIRTLGLIEPMLELSEEKGLVELLRRLSAIRELSQNGHSALVKFFRLWVDLEDQVWGVEKRNPEVFEDILAEARQNPIPEIRLRWRAGESKRINPL
jgi:hypothetical protein